MVLRSRRLGRRMRLKMRVCVSRMDGDEMLCWGFHGQGLRFEDLFLGKGGKRWVRFFLCI